MKIISKDNIILAKLIQPEDIHDGINFFSADDEFLQVGVWKYQNGKELDPHIHNIVERKINRTHEILYVLKGRIEVTIYTLNKVKVETILLKTGDILVLLECGHGYKILEDDTTVFEIKNGPYLGAEIDRQRF
jgi:quercetin dioxygenase-like cupin family protein